MVYIPPQGVDPNQIDNLLYVDGSSLGTHHSITSLLSIFSGYSHKGVNNSLFTFANDISEQSDLGRKLQATPIIPYVRTGGSLVSGTAASFYNGTHFADPYHGLIQEEIAAFEYGNYGKDIKLFSTDEANSRA
jgi:hypothetical protein